MNETRLQQIENWCLGQSSEKIAKAFYKLEIEKEKLEKELQSERIKALSQAEQAEELREKARKVKNLCVEYTCVDMLDQQLKNQILSILTLNK